MSDQLAAPYSNGVHEQPSADSGSASPQITRTVAIIKNHALERRFDIEPRILEASFEIVKERQMEFDVETDPDTLYELFGDDAASLGEGPVWVYVLERRRAIEVWNTLMGPEDPAVAREQAPNSLRALYGKTGSQNGLMGSPDAQTAEIQIASLFASSPVFDTPALAEVGLPADQYDTLGAQSLSPSTLSALRRQLSDDGVTSSSRERVILPNGKAVFRARALPKTHLAPDIAPRTTKAAALRAGLDQGATRDGRLEKSAPRAALTKERLAQTFANVPGHKRADTIAVASTAAPIVAPRLTKAALLRQNPNAKAPTLGKAPPKVQIDGRLPPPKPTEKKGSFEGVPGHKRKESIAVASTAVPTVAPRQNRAAALRAAKDQQGPPSAFQFRGNSSSSLSRASSSGSLNRSNSLSSLTGQKPQIQRPTSAASSSRPSLAKTGSSTSAVTSPEKPQPKPRPSSVALPSSIGTPTIAPRGNKAAALREAKKRAEEEAAAKAKAKPWARGAGVRT